MSLRGKALLCAAMGLWPAVAFAAWPAPSTDPAVLSDPANWPDDPEYAQSWWLFGFTPAALAARLPASESGLTAGAGFDAAWTRSLGSPDAVIALVGSGARWEHPDLGEAWALSEGETPAPQDEAGTSGVHDLNADGAFDARDFTTAAQGAPLLLATVRDPRLRARPDGGDVNGNGVLDPGDLIAVFSDGVDDDGNGFVDDLAGWDFVDSDNDPFDPTVDAPGTHAAARAAARANNGIGGTGACPACRVLPVRVSRDERLDPWPLRAALGYAAGAGAKVAALVGCPRAPSASLDAAIATFVGANARVVVSAACGGATPAPGPGHAVVSAVGPDSEDWAAATTLLAQRCGAGARAVEFLVPAERCGRDAVPLFAAALASGAHGSSPFEALRWLRAAAVSVEQGRSSSPGRGVGRLRLDLVPVPDAAEVRVQEPRLGERRRGTEAVTFAGSFQGQGTLELFAARGSAPKDSELVPIPHTSSGGAFHGTVNLGELPLAANPQDPLEAAALTLRALVRTEGATSQSYARDVVIFFEPVGPALGYPTALGVGAATSPRLVDVDGDGRDEVVVVTRDGRVHALGLGGTSLPGFPLSAPGAQTGDATVVGPPAIPDLEGDGPRELVIGTLEGRLSVLRASDGAVIFEHAIEGGMAAAPVVAPSAYGPVIIALGRRGQLYAFLSGGTPLPQMPYSLPFAATEVTPAAADLDLDGFPDVVVSGIAADGSPQAALVRLTRDGFSLQPGWPKAIAGGAGTPDWPVLADFDGDGQVEIAVGARGAAPRVLDVQGEPVIDLSWETGPAGGPGGLATLAADVNDDGRLELLGRAADGLGLWRVGSQLVSNRRRGATDPAGQVAGFPVNLELAEAAALASADVDGDGEADVLAAGPVSVTALKSTGGAPPEWPRLTFAAAAGGPAVGFREGAQWVALTTEDGWLYAWPVGGDASRLQWDGPGHDPEHTGFYGSPLPPRGTANVGIEGPPQLQPEGCCTGAPGPPSLFGLVLLLWTTLARRRGCSSVASVFRVG